MMKLLVASTTCLFLLLTLSGAPSPALAWNGEAGPYWYQPFKSELDQHQMNFSWSIRTQGTSTYLVGTFSHQVPSNAYVSIGTKSAAHMDGLLIACEQDHATGAAICNDWMGSGYDVDPFPGGSRTTVISSSLASSNESTHTIVFERVLVDQGADLGVAPLTTWDRTIFAWGPMENEGGRRMPGEHPGHSIAAASINFANGQVDIKPSTKFWDNYLALIIFWVMTVVYALVIRIVNECGESCKIHHHLRVVTACVIPATYFALLCLHVYWSWLRYHRVSALGPFMRALGDGAVFCFMGLLLTVTRRGFFSEVFYVSHERAIKYHIVLGVLLVVACVWHMIGMIDMYMSAFLWRLKPDNSGTPIPVWPGVLGFACYAICTFFGFLRFDFSYVLFRATHFAWIPSVVLTILHYQASIPYLAPPLAMIVLGWVYGRIVNCSATTTFAYFHKPSKTLVVEVSRTYFTGCASRDAVSQEIGVGAAQWFYLNFYDASIWRYHPFSIARADVIYDPATGKSVQKLKFAIKQTDGLGGGGGYLQPCLDPLYKKAGVVESVNKFKKMQSWTTKVCEVFLARADPPEEEFITLSSSSSCHPEPIMTVESAGAELVEKCAETTNAVYETVVGCGDKEEKMTTTTSPPTAPTSEHSKKIPPGGLNINLPIPTSVEGPFGSVQLPLHKYKHFVLVSGGIGVTPNLLILQHLSVMASSGIHVPRQILWTWVNRDDAMIHLFAKDIKEFADRAEAAGVKVILRNFVTGSTPPSKGIDDSQLGIVRGRRPDYLQEIHSLKEEEGCSDSMTTAALYGCGPIPMLDSSKAAAAQVTDFKVHVHNEVFNV